MEIALIVAAARNQVIGCNNRLPWHLPQDLKYFKSVTLGKPVIMGRKTFESIGKPLPGRTNIVITRQRNWRAEGVSVAHDIDSAFALAKSAVGEAAGAEVMVIGGAEIYGAALGLARRVYLTRVDLEPEGDAFFPALAAEEWHLVSVTAGDSDAPLEYEFQIFERVGQ